MEIGLGEYDSLGTSPVELFCPTAACPTAACPTAACPTAGVGAMRPRHGAMVVPAESAVEIVAALHATCALRYAGVEWAH